MVELTKSKHCAKCDDDFYNEADMESIKKTRKCVYCAKMVKMYKELGLLEKKRLQRLKDKV